MGHLTLSQRYEFSFLLRNNSNRAFHSTQETGAQGFRNLSRHSSPASSSCCCSCNPPSGRPLYLASRNSAVRTPLLLCRFHEPLNSNLLHSLHIRLGELLLPPSPPHLDSLESLSIRAWLHSNLTSHLPDAADLLTRLDAVAAHLYGPGCGNCEGCSLSRVLQDLPGLYALRTAEYIRKSNGGRLAGWLKIWIEIAEKERDMPYHCADEIGTEFAWLRKELGGVGDGLIGIESDSGARVMAGKVRVVLRGKRGQTEGAVGRVEHPSLKELEAGIGSAGEEKVLTNEDEPERIDEWAELDCVDPEVMLVELDVGETPFPAVPELDAGDDSEIWRKRSRAQTYRCQ